jgi:hypothetical protein
MKRAVWQGEAFLHRAAWQGEALALPTRAEGVTTTEAL